MHGPLQLDVVRAEEAPYRPSSHGPLHNALGVTLLLPNSPAGHAVHTPAPVNEYWPAAHGVAVELVEPSGQAYPALQLPLQPESASPARLP